MLIVDKALAKREAEGRPIRVGMIGAGAIGRGTARQIIRSTPGMRLAAIANHRLPTAIRAYEECGITPTPVESTVAQFNDVIRSGHAAVTEDWSLLVNSDEIDVIFEATGAVEYAARIALATIEAGKHFIHMNAELDTTLGPLLGQYARRHGVIYSNSSGDQPGVTIDLLRFVTGIGVRPVLCGNIKGLQDRTRNPTTQEGFARQWHQNVKMVTSFADGAKISCEQSSIANATGMKVLKRGMMGIDVPAGTPLEQVVGQYPQDRLLDGSAGYVDYCIGAAPAPGVFVIGHHDDPVQMHYLDLYKLGKGPLYLFYTPYHLCHFEAPGSIARAVLFNDATVEPIGVPMVDVITMAKTDLKAGTVLDGFGGYHAYGEADNSTVVLKSRLLPMGISEGCRLKRDIAADTPIGYDDVELPAGRLIDELRAKQDDMLLTQVG